MSIGGPDPTKFKDLHFRIKKLDWSIYEIDHAEVKGTLRLLAVPTNIFEIPKELMPQTTTERILGLNTQGIVGFLNEGKKGPSDPQPLNPADLPRIAKQDLTSHTTTREEPFNEYLIGGNPALLVRTKTVMLKVEWLKDRFNVFGDPQLWVNHNTSHSVTEYKTGELLSP
jgi:hypothetical protein